MYGFLRRRTLLPTLALIVASFISPDSTFAEDLRVGDVATIAVGDEWVARVDLNWRNAWHNERNYDGVWLFFKHRGSHMRVAAEGHRVRVLHATGGPLPEVVVAADGTGLWVVPPPGTRGEISAQLTIALEVDSEDEDANLAALVARGIEMVHVPAGGFWVGDTGGEASESYGGFRGHGADGADYLFRVNDETAIQIGDQPGHMSYVVDTYTGDGKGPIPAEFPKGTEAFWVMKYELSQGSYAEFLNDLWETDTYERARLGGRTYGTNGGSIVLGDDGYHAQNPDRAARNLTWDDQLAFTDWAALRPMTELEFTKAARGPREPLPNEYPWGTASRENLIRLATPRGDLAHVDHTDESSLDDAARDRYGASHYWIMDLAGSVWERVISPGLPDGRAFGGTHGDGRLGSRARATNDDWPHEYAGRAGHGYRGGGYYGPDRAWHEFNPYSPVAYRPFGAWAGYAAERAYGYRAVRTAS
ncbi:MAG: SUMF1/EgtB/PvdO family nonheme iron enzyme [Acidobacteria bacterium]|nr:SUMF1/EgtB/PvdO family nonheme iron enzyme [Acidobacteriota bacterium]